MAHEVQSHGIEARHDENVERLRALAGTDTFEASLEKVRRGEGPSTRWPSRLVTLRLETNQDARWSTWLVHALADIRSTPHAHDRTMTTIVLHGDYRQILYEEEPTTDGPGSGRVIYDRLEDVDRPATLAGGTVHSVEAGAGASWLVTCDAPDLPASLCIDRFSSPGQAS